MADGCFLSVCCAVFALAFAVRAADAPVKESDGMVLVPAGEFVMGGEGKDLDEDRDEKPVHKVVLPAFLVDKLEVTTAHYASFLNAVKTVKDGEGHSYLGLPQYSPIEQVDGMWRPKAGKEQFPMVNVTWFGDAAYAGWAGKRLPTEAEFEKAARGMDGRKYPWGSTLDYGKLRFGQDAAGPVGEYPAGASPYGCLDMAGSVWEWTSSVFKPYPYVGTDGREDPASTERRVARGGSFTGEPHIAHSSYRFRPYPGYASHFLGFRCAKSIE